MAMLQSIRAAFLHVVLAAALLPLHAQAQEPKPGHIKLSTSASAEVAPDVALIQLGVVTEKKVASDAASENAKAAKAVIEQIKSLGIEPRDIRTLSVTVMPAYDEEKDATGRIKRTLRAYSARNILEIRVRQVDKAGRIVSQLIDKGANVLGGVHFGVSDADERLDQLRVRALQEAARKARLYVEAMGVKLGRIVEIEPEIQYPDESAAASMPARRFSDAPPVAIPVEPGMRTLSVRVTVTWVLAE